MPASPSGHALGTLALMLLTPAPSLIYVIGIPAGFMVIVGVFGFGVWMLLGRIHRG